MSTHCELQHRRLHLNATPQPAPSSWRADGVQDAIAEHDPALTCGWFDSSWDLRQGLDVMELDMPATWQH